MPKFLFNKLIQHKLLKVMHQHGIAVVSKPLSTADFIIMLKKKLLEEIQEVVAANTHMELIEEIADVLEVIYTFCQVNNIAINDVEKVRKTKVQDKGSFIPQSYVDSVILPDTQFEFYLNYYRQSPEKYPEVNE